MEIDREEFVYAQEAKNILAYLFLKDFHERFARCINEISSYLSEYNKYNSFFGSAEREAKIKEIKESLLSVVYVLNSIRLDPESSREVRNLINSIDDILNSTILTKDQLKTLLKILGKIVALSFLKDLVKYVPPVSERVKGDFD